MITPPAGISEEDWAATPVGVRAGFLAVLAQLQRQQQENEQLRAPLTALATELASLRERIDPHVVRLLVPAQYPEWQLLVASPLDLS